MNTSYLRKWEALTADNAPIEKLLERAKTYKELPTFAIKDAQTVFTSKVITAPLVDQSRVEPYRVDSEDGFIADDLSTILQQLASETLRIAKFEGTPTLITPLDTDKPAVRRYALNTEAHAIASVGEIKAVLSEGESSTASSIRFIERAGESEASQHTTLATFEGRLFEGAVIWTQVE